MASDAARAYGEPTWCEARRLAVGAPFFTPEDCRQIAAAWLDEGGAAGAHGGDVLDWALAALPASRPMILASAARRVVERRLEAAVTQAAEAAEDD